MRCRLKNLARGLKFANFINTLDSPFDFDRMTPMNVAGMLDDEHLDDEHLDFGNLDKGYRGQENLLLLISNDNLHNKFSRLKRFTATTNVFCWSLRVHYNPVRQNFENLKVGNMAKQARSFYR